MTASTAVGAGLRDLGVIKGDRVALMCSNRPEFLEIYLGCAWMGAVTVPINTALRGIQLSHILRNAMRDGTLERIYRKWGIWDDSQAQFFRTVLETAPAAPASRVS